MNKEEWFKFIKNAKFQANVTMFGRTVVLDAVPVDSLNEEIKKNTKPVVVKEFVADWFEKNKNDLNFAIYEAVAHSIKEVGYKHYPDGFMEWIVQSTNNPFDTLIRMKDGYKVEKEPIYEVVFLEDDDGRYLLMELGEKSYEVVHESENNGYRNQWFKEAEIKEIDERYWAFAVPVEVDES